MFQALSNCTGDNPLATSCGLSPHTGRQIMNYLPLQVESIDKAVKDLESEVGFTCRGYMEGTTSVPDRLKLDYKKLKSYLNWTLKLHSKGEGIQFIYIQHPMIYDFFMKVCTNINLYHMMGRGKRTTILLSVLMEASAFEYFLK